MINEVILPKQGLQMNEGYITKWFFDVGEIVNKGEPLFEMETDKAVIEIESSHSGILQDIIHVAGETVPVATVIGHIRDNNDKDNYYPASEAIIMETVKLEEEKEKEYDSKKEKSVFITPRAKTIAMMNRISFEEIVPSGPNGLIIARDVKEKSKLSTNADMLAIKVSFAGVQDIVNKQDKLKEEGVIHRCLTSALKRCIVGTKFKAKDFNIRYLGSRNISFFSSTSETPSLYVCKPDKDDLAYITFTWNPNYLTEDEALEFADLLYLFIETPLLAYTE